MWRFWTPGLMSAVFVFGAVETGAMGLLPVHALRNGFDAETGALFVAALAGGNMLLQLPIGLLSDRVSRRALLRVRALRAPSAVQRVAAIISDGTRAVYSPFCNVIGD